MEGEGSKELKIEMGNICSLIKSETADIIALLKIKYNQFLSNIDPKIEIYVLVKMAMILDEHQHIKATKNDYLFIQKDEFVGVIDLNKNNALIIIYNTISNNILNSFNSFLRICYSVFVSNHGGFLFHAAGIGMEDKGYIFFGPSESGKTTVAKLSHKFKVLNDDTIIIKKNSGSYSAFGTPLSSSVDRRLNGRNDSMNIHGLFVLKKDKRIYFKKMNYRDSIVSFLSSIIDFPLMLKISEYYQHQSPNIIKNQFVMSCNLLEEIPCYEMHFTLNDSFWGRVQNGTF